jgi:hypothetical protein
MGRSVSVDKLEEQARGVMAAAWNCALEPDGPLFFEALETCIAEFARRVRVETLREAARTARGSMEGDAIAAELRALATEAERG